MNMNGFLALLVSILLICLIVGLASPEVFKDIFGNKTGRRSVGLSIGSLVVVFSVLFIVSAPKAGYQVDENTYHKTTKTTKPLTNSMIKKPAAIEGSATVAPTVTQDSAPSDSSSSGQIPNVIQGSTGTTPGLTTTLASNPQQAAGVVASPPVMHILYLGSEVGPVLSTPIEPICKSLSLNLDC